MSTMSIAHGTVSMVCGEADLSDALLKGARGQQNTGNDTRDSAGSIFWSRLY